MADNSKPKIRVTCKGADTVSLDELEPLQGDLKALTEQGYEKLKQSIVRYGISFPLFYWAHNGSKYCIDGHQRERVLRKMAEEGYKIPRNIPACPISAKDRREACEKILLISSQYGRMDSETLYAFASENELDLLDLGPMLELPQVDFERFKTGYLEDNGTHTNPTLNEQFMIVITCKDETHQLELLERFSQDGIQCRALTS